MTEPRNPGEPEAERPIEGTDAAGESAPDAAESTVTADSPTQAWPSLATPPTPAPASDATPSTWSPPATTYDAGETGTFGASPASTATSGAPSRGRPGLRWILAIAGVIPSCDK